jgi:hypothetical protein
MRRGLEVLVLLSGEDVDGDEVALGVAVLAWKKFFFFLRRKRSDRVRERGG